MLVGKELGLDRGRVTQTTGAVQGPGQPDRGQTYGQGRGELGAGWDRTGCPWNALEEERKGFVRQRGRNAAGAIVGDLWGYCRNDRGWTAEVTVG